MTQPHLRQCGRDLGPGEGAYSGRFTGACVRLSVILTRVLCRCCEIESRRNWVRSLPLLVALVAATHVTFAPLFLHSDGFPSMPSGVFDVARLNHIRQCSHASVSETDWGWAVNSGTESELVFLCLLSKADPVDPLQPADTSIVHLGSGLGVVEIVDAEMSIFHLVLTAYFSDGGRFHFHAHVGDRGEIVDIVTPPDGPFVQCLNTQELVRRSRLDLSHVDRQQVCISIR